MDHAIVIAIISDIITPVPHFYGRKIAHHIFTMLKISSLQANATSIAISSYVLYCQSDYAIKQKNPVTISCSLNFSCLLFWTLFADK